MNFVWTILQSDPVEMLVLTLLNSLWQGVVWLLLLMAVLWTLPARRGELRYVLAVSSLGGVVLTALVTWSLLSGQWGNAPTTTVDSLPTGMAASADATGSPVMNPGVAAIGPSNRAPLRSLGPTDMAEETNIRSRGWVAATALVWICGFVLMLVRGLRSIAAARRLVRGPECEDHELLGLLNATRSRLGLRRPVRLVLADALSSPIVWGVWRPVLLLPASLAGNLSVAELEAVFAHELAHVRRYDHVVNLVQMLIESILFFNPAVWWISRQIRLEREACCDAAAARLTENPVGYASLLAAHAERQAGARAIPAVTPALAATSHGTLLDRVRRILSPSHRPGMRLSWFTCVLLIVVSGAVLYGLYRGTDVAVGVAAEIMSDEERIETITDQARQTTPAIIEEPAFDEVRIRGQVVIVPSLTTVDEVHIQSYVRQENHSAMSGIGTTAGEFDVTVPAGTIWLFFSHRDAAVSILGPFGPQDGPDIADQMVVITEGEDVTLRVVDDENQPAAGVTVSASAVVHGNGIGSARGVTDDEGIVHLSHISPDNEYSLVLSGHGYQKNDPPDARLNPEEVATLTVSRALPARGVVVDERGQPIPGVQIREYITQRQGHTNNAGGIEDSLATTDANGEFVLDQLRDGWRYHLLLQHSRFADAVLADVEAGDEGIRGTMAPGVTVRGKVHDADKMDPDDRRLSWGEVKRLPLGEHGGMRDRTLRHWDRVEFGEDGSFTLEHVAPGLLEITLAGQTRTYDVGPESTQVTIDYEPPAPRQTRALVIRFEHDGQPVKPEGHLRLNGLSDQVGDLRLPYVDVRLEDGEARVEVPVPMTRPSLHADADGLIGFWFSSHDVEWPVLEPGENAYELVIPVFPAGAVEGEILTSDGLPAVGVGVGVMLRFEYPGSPGRSYSGGINVNADAAGRFFVTPLPLGAPCVTAISDGFYREVGDEFTLDGTEPVRSVSMTMGPRSDVAGRVLGPDGEPLGGIPVELYFSHPGASMSWGPPETTDREGRFQFSGLNAAADGRYEAHLEFNRDYVSANVPLLSGETNEIRLEAGRVLTGRTLNEKGEPVPGIEVYAMRSDLDLTPGAINTFEAEAATDAEGRFRFSNLPDDRMGIHARQLVNERTVTVQAGQSDEITLQGEVPTWYRDQIRTTQQIESPR